MGDLCQSLASASDELLLPRDRLDSWLYELYHVAFPGAYPDDPRIHVGADSVVVEFTYKGRNDGPFAGNPPTHRSVSVPMCVAYDIETRRIARIRAYYDAATMMRQLTN